VISSSEKKGFTVEFIVNLKDRNTIVITQNAEVSASEAVLQRIIHLNFDKSGHNSHTKVLSEKLEKMPLEHVSHFIEMAVQSEERVIQLLKERTPKYEIKLLMDPQIKTVRIAKNHAQMMALLDGLAEIIGLNVEIKNKVIVFLKDMAIARQRTIAADHPLVVSFWEQVEYLEEQNQRLEPLLNHSSDPQLMAVNINHYIRVANDYRQQVPLIADLKRVLKSGKRYKFLGIKSVKSAITTTTVKCWVFQMPEDMKRGFEPHTNSEQDDWLVA
jgi:hypothetical protein